ncbi:translation initiation factor IF-1 [Mesomycoplasma moatsii]|uniref:translation initiation factor IF-1 n=1 Tax=Mesomycoplasma moatsii TaxID=171287 RepID=UPI0003B7028F
MAKDAIKMVGKVTKSFSTREYQVELENKMTIKATVSGKINLHSIRILPGDTVDVEISPYDLSQGRIVFRHK